MTIVRLLFVNFIIVSFVNSTFSEIKNGSARFNRISFVISSAWRKCNKRLEANCTKEVEFCNERLFEMRYEEWELLKPSSECHVTKNVLPRLCKLLFNETCYSNSNGILKSQTLLLTELLFTITIIQNCILP